MAYNYSEGLMPRNAPKQARPLVMVAATPLVPEVSLLLDEDKNKSLHLMKPPVVKPTEDSRLADNFQLQDQNKIPFPDQFESYNAWKSKNAQAENITKHVVDSRKLNGTGRKQTNGNEYPNLPESKEILSSLPIGLNQIPNKTSTSYRNKPALEFDCNNEKFTRRHVQNFERQSSIYTNKPVQKECCIHENCSLPKDNEIYPRMRDIYQLPIECQCQDQNTVAMNNPHNNKRNTYVENIHLNTCGIQDETCWPNNRNPTPSYGINNNQEHCQCRQENDRVCLANGMECFSMQSAFLTEPSNNNIFQMLNSKAVSPLDIPQINNQSIKDLYCMVRLQNEKISILEQQIQTLQINFYCDRASVKQNCFHKEKNKQDPVKHARTNDSKDENCVTVSNSKQKKTPTPSGCYKNAKRSIGVMTSFTEGNIDICLDTHTQMKNNNSPKSKKQQQIKNHPSSHQWKNSSQRGLPCNEDAKKTRYTSTPAMKPNEKLIACSQVDRSFYLNEPELIHRLTDDLDVEHEDISSNITMHHEMQEFDRSPSESDKRKPHEQLIACSQVDRSFYLNEPEFIHRLTDDLDLELEDIPPDIATHHGMPEWDISSSESDESDGTECYFDEGDASGTDDNSSDPGTGWTFYYQALAQVKKTATPRQQVQAQYIPKRISSNFMYKTENNLSKRVIFEKNRDNMPNMMCMPVLNQARQNEDFRRNNVPDRMQDSMMYNSANVGTNQPISTLSYLKRYNLLPTPQVQNMPPGHVHQGYQKNNKQNKKKKSRNVERYPQNPQRSQP